VAIESADNTLLEVRNLCLSAMLYPASGKPSETTIVDNVSFTLQRGQVLGLIGESGAGKSTVGLAAMAYGRGSVRISGGEILFNGTNIRQADKQSLRSIRGSQICYVAQSAAAGFNPAHRLIDQVIESALKKRVAGRRALQARAVELFATLGLPEPDTIGERFPHQVSGGQLQRIMTAMALCSEPELIIFDEPTTALDVTTQIDVLIAIRHAIKSTGVAALYISHDLAVVAQVSDEIMVLRDGRMVEHGETRQIIDQPAEAYTQALINVRSIDHTAKAPHESPLLNIQQITASYPGSETPVLCDVNATLSAGQTLAIVGESGSGKSTLARVITGLLPPAVGEIHFNGQRLPSQLKQRSRENLRELQMIYQMADVAMNPRQTVRTIIGRPLSFYFNLRGSERDRRVDQLLEQIEMGSGYADRYPAELSGGQKQRVCIARALAAEPRLIICDEVTSALDPLVADGILKLLLDLQRVENVAYLFITHDLATVRAIADSIAVMYQGGLVRYGTKQQVLSPPYDGYTQRLLNSVPQMQAGWLDRAIADVDAGSQAF
jgi:peptide/nickel transport system ATP-binding protein